MHQFQTNFMIHNKYHFITILLMILGVTQVQSQEKEKDKKEVTIGTEVVNVVKPYTPTISDAFKVKATPKLNDAVNTVKKKVTYSIFSVPVASTFTPSKGNAATLKKPAKIKLYDNYATLGFGSLTTALAEFYSNVQLSRTENFGVFLNHNSSQGGIDGVAVDDFFYDTRLNVNYGVRERDLSWKADLDIQHQVFNWYGITLLAFTNPDVINFGDFDPTHSYVTAALKGSLSFNDAIFKEGDFTLRYLGDSESSTELRALAKPTFEFPIGGEQITTTAVLDYVSGSFDNGLRGAAGVDYSFINVGVQPGLVILRDDLTVNLGLKAYVSLDTENSETDFFAYPNVTASYRVVGDYFIAYGGLEGDLIQNNYYDIVQENPFVSPSLFIQPTNQQYDGFLGIKGKLSNTVSYNLRGSLINENDKALFRLNDFETLSAEVSRPVFENGNSFGLVYDDVTTFSVFGELNFDVNSKFKLKINGQFNSYSTDNEIEAWNLPEITASVFGDYQINEQWFVGANIFFVGERFDRLGIIDPVGIFETTTVSLESYFDVNAHVGYRINDRLSAFGRINNIFDNNYQKFLNFQVQGLQALMGATYKFDF